MFFRAINSNKCAWIGASTLGSGEFRWIETPPNYGEDSANGELLTNTFNNFSSGQYRCRKYFL